MRPYSVPLLLLMAGCGAFRPGSTTEKTSEWYEVGQVRKSREDIARTVREMVTRSGYQVTQFNETADLLETDWDVHLSTRFREGYRSKIETEILPAETGGGFNVRVRSWLELNDQDKYCNVPERAEWVGAGISEKHKDRIGDAAIRLRTQLKLRFFGLNP